MPSVSPRGPQTFLSIWRLYPPESSSVCPVLHLRTHQRCKPLHRKALTSTSYLQIFWGSTVLLAEDGDGCFTCRDTQQLWKEGVHPPQTTTQSLCWVSAWHLRQASVTCSTWHIYYTPSPRSLTSSISWNNMLCPLAPLQGACASVSGLCRAPLFHRGCGSGFIHSYIEMWFLEELVMKLFWIHP